MALLDRFRAKPEWQSPDPAVRAEAVRHIPAQEQALLSQLARQDVDPRVRRAAVKKLSDPAVLAGLLKDDADAGVREEAGEILLAIALHEKEAQAAETAVAGLTEARHLAAVAKGAVLEAARRSAVARLTDPRALAAVAREADDGAIRLEAVARLEDPAALAALAQKCEHKAVALAAVEKTRDAEALRRIAASARVGAAARRAAALLPPEEAPAPDGPPPGERQGEEEARRAEEERSYARDARVALCEKAEAAEAEGAAAAALETRAAWDRLPPLAGAEADALLHRFEKACADALSRHEAWAAGEAARARRAELVAEAGRLCESADLLEARRRFEDIEKQWVAQGPAVEEPLRARFEAAAARLRAHEAEAKEDQARHEKVNLRRLQALCERLASLAASPSFGLRDGERALREAKEALDSPGPLPSRKDKETLLPRLEAARKALYPRVQELRQDAEWQRWANVTVQEELIAEAEALLGATNLEAAAVKLHDIDTRWRQVAEAPKDKAESLWHRFKGARDQVRARCDAYFAERDRQWAENLKSKEALCERVEALAESTDWVRTAEEIQNLQAEWKRIGPVARKRSKAVWERFRKPCDRFFTRRAQDRRERAAVWAANLARKEALCAQAEALAEPTDWEEAAAGIKRLQAEWKTIGAVKKTRSEAVWQRFRAACDRFFERYKNRHQLAAEASQTAREALCREIEALAPREGAAEPEPPPPDLLARLQAAQTGWRQAPPLGSSDPLAERFARARDRLLAAYPEAFAGTELDPEISRRKLEKLCSRVEAVVAELEPKEASGQELAEQLRRALAANTIGGRAAAEARWHSATEEVEAARAAAKRLGPVPGEAGSALRERFEKAARRFYEIRPRAASRPSHREPARSSP